MTQVPLKVSCNICACVFVASKTTVNYLNGLLCTPSYRITILTTEQRGSETNNKCLTFETDPKVSWWRTEVHADLHYSLSIQKLNEHYIHKAVKSTDLLLMGLTLPENWQFCSLCSITDVNIYLTDSEMQPVSWNFDTLNPPDMAHRHLWPYVNLCLSDWIHLMRFNLI